MEGWKTELNCKNCNEILDIQNGSTNTICPRCQTKYEILTNEICYAICESGEYEYYKFLDNNKIGRSCFENPPIDILEKAYQDTRALNVNENSPQILLDIIKKYHDSLKMCVRRLIELNSGNLTSAEKQQVLNDDLKDKKSLSIKNLSHYLKRAFPIKSLIIDACFEQHKDMIERIWWVRNKLEHILYTQWPINSNIFQDFDKNPNSPDQAPDHLNYDFLKRTNNTVIEIYRFILDLRPNTPKSWQIVTVEKFRI